MRDPNRLLLPLASAAIMTIFLGVFLNKLVLPFGANISFIKREDKKVVVLGNKKVYVELADTPQKRQLGLSGRKKLGKDEGMLFIFDGKDSQPSFWMEGMQFAIDIIWINDEEVSQVHLDVLPPKPETASSELSLYKPYNPIDYVLEVNAGFVEKHGIAVGTSVDLSKIEETN